jgi:hypothetical protein
MSVNRYDYEDFDMVISEYGGYVKYEDYESLEEEWKILKRDYENLVEKIGDLYRSA